MKVKLGSYSFADLVAIRTELEKEVAYEQDKIRYSESGSYSNFEATQNIQYLDKQIKSIGHRISGRMYFIKEALNKEI